MKAMNCRDVRDRLTGPADARRDPALVRHLDDCATCRSYADRLETARQLLREHHGNVEPDSAFAGRVVARLPQGPTEVLGWAALRLLPATVVLALVLAWFAFQSSSPLPSVEPSAPTDDLLSWVIDPSIDASGDAP